MSGDADTDKDLFLKNAHAQGGGVLSAFQAKMDGYQALATKITAIRGCAMLNMFEIDAADMNAEMASHAARYFSANPS